MTARAGLQRVVKTIRGKHGAVHRTYWVKGTGTAPTTPTMTARRTVSEVGIAGTVRQQHNIAATTHNPTNIIRPVTTTTHNPTNIIRPVTTTTRNQTNIIRPVTTTTRNQTNIIRPVTTTTRNQTNIIRPVTTTTRNQTTINNRTTIVRQPAIKPAPAVSAAEAVAGMTGHVPPPAAGQGPHGSTPARTTTAAPSRPSADNFGVIVRTGAWNYGKMRAARHGLDLVAQVHASTTAERVLVHPTSVVPFYYKHKSAYSHREGGALDEIRADRSSYKTLIHYGEHVITRTPGSNFHSDARIIGGIVRRSESWRSKLNMPGNPHYQTALYGGDTTAFAHGYAQYIATKTGDKRALREMHRYGLALNEREFAEVAPRYESLLRDRQGAPRTALRNVFGRQHSR